VGVAETLAHHQAGGRSTPKVAAIVMTMVGSKSRIRGAKSVPIAKLKTGTFHTVDGKWLQVNSSVERY
jgi:chromosome partitioning protein